MLYEVVMSVCSNICLLVVLALLMTKLEFVQKILLNEEDEEAGEKGKGTWLWEKLIVGVIFGVFCCISDYIGMQVTGAIPNARVIGVLSAGMLGGPLSCGVTTLIACVHRYIIFPERISTVACILATMIHGVMGAVIGYKKRDDRQYSNRFLLIVTFVAEAIHMILILVLTRPFADAVDIVKVVIIPMVVINSVGMVIFFNVFKAIFNNEDLKVASRISLAMRTTERCIPYLADAEINRDSMGHIVEIIKQEARCVGVAIIRDMEFLGSSSAFDGIALTKDNYPRLLHATRTYKNTRISKIPLPEDGFYSLYEHNVVISAPIFREEDQVLCLVILVKKSGYSYRADIEFATGLANYFSTQMKLADMEKQKEALRRAEIQTLQSQINPHFLFNSLNTISCFCREKPEKARELLLALSSYFRNMLESMDYMVTLETELDHVKAYTMLEEARFEDQLSVKFEAKPEDLNCRVPNLILQPIVENAIHHGAMKRARGTGTVVVVVRRDEKNTVIDVSDNGPGIDYRIIRSLYGGEKAENTGIGMMNVQQRLRSIYGKQYGLQIVSSETGTDVRMSIPNQEVKNHEDSDC